MFSQLFWTSECSLGEHAAAWNKSILCLYRSHLTELVRNKEILHRFRNKFQGDTFKFSSVGCARKQAVKSHYGKKYIDEYGYRIDGVVSLDTETWNKILSDNVTYQVKNWGGSKDNLSWETASETQNVTLVMIKSLWRVSRKSFFKIIFH